MSPGPPAGCRAIRERRATAAPSVASRSFSNVSSAIAFPFCLVQAPTLQSVMTTVQGGCDKSPGTGRRRGGPGGNRTRDLRIKSPLLCRLSYRPKGKNSRCAEPSGPPPSDRLGG